MRKNSLLLVLLFSCFNMNYVKFKIVVLPDNNPNKKLLEINDPIPEEVKRNIIVLLTFFEEDFKISDDGDILITKELYKDKELLWNYSMKSVNVNWHFKVGFTIEEINEIASKYNLPLIKE